MMHVPVHVSRHRLPLLPCATYPNPHSFQGWVLRQLEDPNEEFWFLLHPLFKSQRGVRGCLLAHDQGVDLHGHLNAAFLLRICQRLQAEVCFAVWASISVTILHGQHRQTVVVRATPGTK